MGSSLFVRPSNCRTPQTGSATKLSLEVPVVKLKLQPKVALGWVSVIGCDNTVH